MSRVLIVAVGSHGDVAPLTGVGTRLQTAGHQVVIAAFAPFADLITDCGLVFREIPTELGIDADVAETDPMKGLAASFAPHGVRMLGEGVLSALRDETADILLLSPLAEFPGHVLAEAKGIPSLGVRLQPLSATSAYPPSLLGAWSAGATGNRLASDAGAWLLDRLYGGVIAGFRREFGLPPTSARAMRRARTHAKWPILYGYSSSVLPRPDDWRVGLDVVGYWWPARTAEWQPPAELDNFLAAGPPPVFVGLGSTMYKPEQAERMSDIIGHALRQAGVRGIVQVGWAGLSVTDDDVMTVGDVRHDWLFPQVAAVVHHCGAGTTAAGLRAGVPAVALPGLGDQAFWARRLRDLGASAGTIPQRKLTVDHLAAAIGNALSDRRIKDNASLLASRIATEDGAAHVLARVESLIGDRRP